MDEQAKIKTEIFIGEVFLFAKNFINQLHPTLRVIFFVSIGGIFFGYFIGMGIGFVSTATAKQQLLVKAKPGFVEVKPLRIIGKVNLLDTPGGQSAYVRLKNDNLELSLTEGVYTFLFYNSQGSLVARQEENFFMVPNQELFLVVPKFIVKNAQDKAVKAEVSFKNLSWVRRLTLPKVELAGTPVFIEPDSVTGGFVVKGKFVNTSQYYLRSVRSVVLVYDSEKEIIAVSARDTTDVPAGATVGIDQIFPGLTPPEGGSAEIISTTNILDFNNLRFK